ncbi:MAG: Asp-tRNA(Asn)/Glu-tRNA(Gln) amidotransferase subunit GatC [Solirubrobacterales bacterium]|nr:Asp-tRNA(Asn)/Glu-tRNA(Gln) amidotransferase subunit GatC [Solirubrobacterales bacterium]
MIERDEVLHIARLSRLRLSEEEIGSLTGDLSSILDHVGKLSEVDIEGVEPTSHVVPLRNVLRDDQPRPSLPPEVALAQAPDPSDGAFRVPSPQAEA